MYLIDDNTRQCVGVIDVVRMESPDIMGGVIIYRATSIEVILDTGRELEFLAKDLYVDSVRNYHIRKMDTKKIPTLTSNVSSSTLRPRSYSGRTERRLL